MQTCERRYYSLFALCLALVPLLTISFPRAIAYVPALAGLAGFAAYYFVFRVKPVLSCPAIVISGAIAIIMFVSSLWAIDPDQSLERALKTSPLLIAGALFISCIMMIRIDLLRPYLRFLPWALFFTALAVAIELGLNFPLYRAIRGEFDIELSRSVFNRATVTVILLLIPTLAIMARYYSRKICALAFLITIMPLLLLGESQSAQLALIVGGMTYFLFPCRWKWVWPVTAVLIYVLMLALPFIFIWAFNQWAADVQTMPVLGRGGGNAGSRMEIWDYVSRYALQNPLYGYGVEATKQVPHFDSHELYQKGHTILHPHNYALQLWMEFGVIGITLCGAMMGWLLMQMGKLAVPQARVAVSTLFAVLVVSSTGYGLWQGWWLGLLFAVCAYTLIAVRLAGQNDNSMTNAQS